jgi:transcriptional antiterminator RfaH
MTAEKEEKSNWYLLYTNPRAEKKVEAELIRLGYEVFLPSHKTIKQWSDRKKWVEEPLFRSYLFLYTNLEKNYYSVLNTHGIVKFVSFDKKPAVVDPREISLVKLMLGSNTELNNALNELDENKIIELLAVGDEVEIQTGPLKGTIGVMSKQLGNNRIIIELKSLRQNLILTISSNLTRKINSLATQQ